MVYQQRQVVRRSCIKDNWLLMTMLKADEVNTDNLLKFLHTVRDGNLEGMLGYLNGSIDINASRPNGLNALLVACDAGHAKIVSELMARGANVDLSSKKDNSALHAAAIAGHAEVVKILLENGANVNIQTYMGFTPLYMGAQEGHVEVVKCLLDNGAIQCASSEGFTPLAVAVNEDHNEIVRLLIENETKGKVKLPILHFAAMQDDITTTTLLIQRGENIVNGQTKRGFTPLHMATQRGHTRIVSFLLRYEADVNCKSQEGLTPLHLSAQEDMVHIAEILVKHKALIDPQTMAGYTPLHIACHLGNINMVWFLLQQDSSVNLTSNFGYTSLHQAAQQGHSEVVDLLVKYKASPNTLTNRGHTPLSIAQSLGCISVIDILRPITDMSIQKTLDDRVTICCPESTQGDPVSDSDDEEASPIFGKLPAAQLARIKVNSAMQSRKEALDREESLSPKGRSTSKQTRCSIM